MSELTRDLVVEPFGSEDVDVRGVAYDSRRVEPGDLFVAWSGEHHDGVDFVPQAVERGAVAVLAPTPPVDASVSWFVAADPRRLLGPLAARLEHHPDRELVHVGVTGTNGKSTVLELLASILESAGRPTGRIGTLGYRFAELRKQAARTTPEGSDYFGLLRRMRDLGAAAAVAEISSHALAQGRVAGGRFDLAVFTNLSRDHLDFHGDLESYFAAKSELFAMLKAGGRAAVSVDDEYGRRLCAGLPEAVGFGRGANASVAPLTVELDVEGSRGELRTPRGSLEFESRLVGSYNLSNILAAVAGAEALELSPEAIQAGLRRCAPLAGRMELVSRRGGFPVVVDYAHTPAALDAALQAVRGLAPRRLIVVFGCGGDRDRGKRSPMGRVAGEGADIAVVTSDNPRGEDPAAIVADVVVGLEASGGVYEVEVDRRAAIRRAIELADGEATVLVAGKGHERTQTVRGEDVPFSDQEEILMALEERLGPSKAG